ncbi:MAG TPA: hypothetical protein VF234_06840, partial [Limnochordia bacterium]
LHVTDPAPLIARLEALGYPPPPQLVELTQEQVALRFGLMRPPLSAPPQATVATGRKDSDSDA